MRILYVLLSMLLAMLWLSACVEVDDTPDTVIVEDQPDIVIEDKTPDVEVHVDGDGSGTS